MSGRNETKIKPSKAGFYANRPWYHPIAIVRRLISYYLTICVGLFLMQGSLLFPRWISGAAISKEAAFSQAKDVGLVPWTPPLSGATFEGYVPRDFSKKTTRGTIVVFHGNAGCAFDRIYYPDAFSKRGFRTLLYEYPGYGGRPGTPSAASIVGEAQELIRTLDRIGLGPVYIWGESVGSGIAAEVCQDTTLPVHGLTLLTPWDSLTHAAMAHYPIVPVSLLLLDKYDSVKNLAHFHHPVCVICSTNDTILPPTLGRNLFVNLPDPKKLIMQDGCGHNDWPSSPDLAWWDDALDFITSGK